MRAPAPGEAALLHRLTADLVRRGRRRTARAGVSDRSPRPLQGGDRYADRARPWASLLRPTTHRISRRVHTTLSAPIRVERVDLPRALLAAASALAAADTSASSPSSGVRHKPGGRAQHMLPLDAPGLDTILAALGRPRESLVFASMLVARRDGDGPLGPQRFHRDGAGEDASASRTLMYLTDVETADDGSIEFDGCRADPPRAVIGPRGTAISYAARSLHRGRTNLTGRADRHALGLAFSASGLGVDTIGGGGGVEFNPDGPRLQLHWVLCLTLLMFSLFMVFYTVALLPTRHCFLCV